MHAAIEAYRVLRKNSLTFAGCIIVLLMLTVGVTAPLLAPYNPVTIDIPGKLLPPGVEHWFGTDEMGRDILSRVMYGCRISIQVGLSIVLIAAIAGTVIGSISGYTGGKVDQSIMTATDIVYPFPQWFSPWPWLRRSDQVCSILCWLWRL